MNNNNEATKTLSYYREAVKFLEMAKGFLLKGQEVVPVALAKVGDQLQVSPLLFTNAEEKRQAYCALGARLLPLNPQWLVTINDAYGISKTAGPKLEAGNLAERFAQGDPAVSEMLVMMVFPRGEKSWSLSLRYTRKSDTVLFAEEEICDDIGGTIPEVLQNLKDGGPA